MPSSEQDSLSVTFRELDILEAMDGIDWWMRPMDVGGHDGSHHGATLRRMADKGLVECRGRKGCGQRTTYKYRITPLGQAIMDDQRRTITAPEHP